MRERSKAHQWRNTTSVRRAIATARAVAEDKGVPLTVERLCAGLAVHPREMEQLLAEADTEDESLRLVKKAVLDCYAALVEDGLRARGATQHIFLEKVHLGYGETKEAAAYSPVLFDGEDEIPD
jgi:hypothetical protein